MLRLDKEKLLIRRDILSNIILFPGNKTKIEGKPLKVRVRMTAYPESIKIISRLIDNELRKINRNINIFKVVFEISKTESLEKVKDIFEGLIEIVSNSKDMSFLETLSFEQLDCLLGVIELRLQEFELLELAMITGVDAKEQQELIKLCDIISPFYDKKAPI